MKTDVLLILLLLITATCFGQTIRRVNNNPGITGTNIYTTLQAAHDAAVDGDLIYVEPSKDSYGDLSISKKLTFYGNGYFKEQNPDLWHETNMSPSKANYVKIVPGATGTVLSGLYITNLQILATSNITITHCQLDNGCIIGTRWLNAAGDEVVSSVSNISLVANYIESNVSISGHATAYTVTNTLISNNRIDFGIDAADTHVFNTIVKNNTLGFSGIQGYISVRNASVENNVLAKKLNSFGGYTCEANCTVTNNVSGGDTFPGINQNQNNVDLAKEFILDFNAPYPPNKSFDEAYILKDTSPLKTAGTGGIEVGMFGGATPYKLFGISAVPSFSKIINTSTGSATHPLTVTISAKSNN